MKSILAVVLALPLLIFAQTDQARLTGTVTDQQGAVVPGAEITVSNTATGFTRTVTSNETGVYLVTGLLPGMYKIVGKSGGLGPTEYTEINLAVGQERHV